MEKVKTPINMVLLFVFALISLYFFELRILRQIPVFEYVRSFAHLIVVVLAIPYLFRYKGGFVTPMLLISLSVLFSILMANYSWGQSILDGFKATLPYSTWFLFFYLLFKLPEPKQIEKLILILGIIYILLYFYQVLAYPTKVFGWNNYVNEERGVIRVLFPGGGVFYLMLFLALSKYSVATANKGVWLVLLLISLAIVFFQVTRQNIVATLIVLVIHFVSGRKLYTKIIAVIIVSGALFIYNYSNFKAVAEIRKIQQKETKMGDDYIRVQAAMFFLNDYSPNIESRILGNGMSYGKESVYGKFKINLEKKKLFHLEDVGLISFYTLFGVFGVLGFLMLMIRSIKVKLPPRFRYLKYYLWFILITMFTSHAPFHYYYLFSTVIAVYLFHYIEKVEIYNKQVLNEEIKKLAE